MKKQVPIKHANRLVNTGCVVLVTSKHEGKVNIITLAWHTPLSHNPMLLGIAVAKSHFSNELIEKCSEFVINIPEKSILKEVQCCGMVSGRKVDKFKENNLHIESSQEIDTPGILECIANIECRVVNSIGTGDHTFFIGRVLYAKVEERLFDFDKNCWKITPQAELLHHLGKNLFVVPNKLIKP